LDAYPVRWSAAFEVIVRERIKQLDEARLKCCELVYDKFMGILGELVTKMVHFVDCHKTPTLCKCSTSIWYYVSDLTALLSISLSYMPMEQQLLDPDPWSHPALHLTSPMARGSLQESDDSDK
jgi:hypothetical protein